MAEDAGGGGGGGAGVLAEALGNMAPPSDPLRNEGEEAKGTDEGALGWSFFSWGAHVALACG